MAFKLMVFIALVSYAHGGAIGYAPAAAAVHPVPLAHHVSPAIHAAPALAYNSAPIYQHAPAPLVSYAAAPVAKAVIAKSVDAEFDPHPQYSYSYDVHDSLTGDAKSQQETRDGDVVRGSYSLLEADGTRRVVDYTADSVNGFNAVVRKEPAAVAIKTVAPAPLAVASHVAAPAAIIGAQHLHGSHYY